MPITPHVSATLLFVAAFATGCTQSRFEDVEKPILERQLEEGVGFAILPSPVDPSSDAALVASGVWLEEAHSAFALDVAGGSADVLLVDGALELEELTVRLEGFDHEIPGGSRFTDIALVLEEPVALETELVGESVSAAAEVPLRLDWSIATDDSTLPLASQAVDALPITLRIEKDGEELRLEADLRQAGLVFELDGLFVVERLDVTVAARER